MTTETLQTAMRLLTLLDQERPPQEEVTVETIKVEEDGMFKRQNLTCSDPITVDEACKIIGRAQGKDRVSRPTVFKHLKNGNLKRYKMKDTKRTMLSRAQVIELVTPTEA